MGRAIVTGELLAQGELYAIWARGATIWCEVRTSPATRPDQGARAADEMADFLIERVFTRRSAWLGAVLDVRRGPSVFGPRTYARIEQVFTRAEQVRRRLAVLVGMPMQAVQFSALASRRAPTCCKVADVIAEVFDWMTAREQDRPAPP